MQHQFLPSQFLHPSKPAAELQILAKILYIKNVAVEKLLELLQVALDRQPFANVLLVGKILIGHVAGIAAEWNFADRIHAEERDHGARRILADFLSGN